MGALLAHASRFDDRALGESGLAHGAQESMLTQLTDAAGPAQVRDARVSELEQMAGDLVGAGLVVVRDDVDGGQVGVEGAREHDGHLAGDSGDGVAL